MAGYLHFRCDQFCLTSVDKISIIAPLLSLDGYLKKLLLVCAPVLISLSGVSHFGLKSMHYLISARLCRLHNLDNFHTVLPTGEVTYTWNRTPCLTLLSVSDGNELTTACVKSKTAHGSRGVSLPKYMDPSRGYDKQLAVIPTCSNFTGLRFPSNRGDPLSECAYRGHQPSTRGRGTALVHLYSRAAAGCHIGVVQSLPTHRNFASSSRLNHTSTIMDVKCGIRCAIGNAQPRILE